MVRHNIFLNTFRSRAITAGLFISLVFFGGVLQAANITVHSSRNPVAVDDSFHLLYEADDDVDRDPDFSPLSKDFDILSSSQSTSMRYINGNYSQKKSWDLSIIAKKTGKFTIPSINFGKDISPAIQITVHQNTATTPNPSTNNQDTTQPSIFLESSLDKKETWVQAQLVYTIRLLRNISVIGGSLTETPETNDSDAIIHKISEDSYETTRNNIRYEVFERRYAIFPQKSGTLKINPMTFEGRISTGHSRNLFDRFSMNGKIKRLRSKPLTATVKAAPTSINLQDWLPANKVQLIDEWSDDVQKIKTGEPITRTITVIADGLTGLQLPDFSIEEIDNIKQYPDKPVIENRKSTNAKGLTGMKQIKVAMIPASAGSYTLPEVKLSWWNTTNNKQETAIIPKKTITVTGSITTTEQTPSQLNTPTIPVTENKLEQSPAFSHAENNNENLWQWLSFFFAIAWLATLFLFFRKPKYATTTTHRPAKEKQKSTKSLAAAVTKHAQKNNAKQTKDALIQWAKIFFEDTKLNNLTQISDHCQTTLSDEIMQLNKTIYSPEHVTWNGEKLLAAFKEQQSHSTQQLKNETTALKPLYQK